MPKITMTDAKVAKLTAPAGGRVDYFDKGYPGLGLRVGGRSRSWFVMVRVGGKLKRHPLGDYGTEPPGIDLAAARDAWRKAREQVQAGKPPRPVERSRDAIENVVADWLRRDQKDNATHDEVKRAFDKVILPAWSGRSIGTIDRRDVLDVLDAIADRGKIGRANKMHAWINRLMVWSVGRGIIPSNPMEALPKYGDPVVRDRALSDPEIRALWKATKAIGWPYGSLVQLLLLTLAREAEIAKLTVDEIDTKEGAIRLAGDRTKNGEGRTIPLSPMAWRVLQSGPRISGCRYVFPASSGEPITGWSKYKTRLDRLMGVNEPWRLHDMRRTGASALEAMKVPLQVTEAILGHTAGSKGGIVRVYQQHDYGPEKRDALARWGGRVLELVA